MSAPPFALPAPDSPAAPVAARPARPTAGARGRALAAAGALGATAFAATLALAAALVVFEADVLAVLERPAGLAAASPADLNDLAWLPGASPRTLVALLPAVALLLLAGLLRRLGTGAPPIHDVSPEALAAAAGATTWAGRGMAVAAFLVFIVPALLQLGGIRTVSLTSGSMAPAHPPGSLLLVGAPPPAGIREGAVAVFARPDGARVTHRVVGTVRAPGGEVLAYRTRGDAARAPDAVAVPAGAVDGVVLAGVPVLGALRAWLASPLGIATGLVLAWSFAGLGALLGDDRRRALAARRPADQAVARSTRRPTS
jgi:signal peptidase I